MKNFLVYTLATITGIILASVIFFFMMLGSLSIMVASGEKPVSISKNSILVLKSGITTPDRTSPDPFSGIDIINMNLTSVAGLNDILANLKKAATDNNIKGILIENGLMSSGWATTEEIRSALLKFKQESGKFILSYSDYVLLQECYYLSTAADKIYIGPGSYVDFKGLSGEVMFYKKALEKIGVEVQVTRHGKFKGAVEPFILDELSAENREQINDYVGSIWNHVLLNIAESRKISVEKLNSIADNLEGNISDSAMASGLVDGLIFRDALIDSLKILSGLTIDDKIELVPMTKYTKVPKTTKQEISKNRISIIYAEGDIVTGQGNDNNIGGNSYADVIRKERKDTSVKAIVLRVNSPGGNAVASDIIWREVMLAAKVKPVVVSMGNYAASGGYYISAAATKIYADPVTISGSIGVFGLIPNVGTLLEQKIGINSETVNTNKYSDYPSVFRPMSDYEKNATLLSIEKVYSDFVGKVSDGRKLKSEYIDSIGQGRVWSGISAQKIGLIDEIGGITESIAGAAKLAGIDSYSIRELPAVEDSFTRILNQLSGNIKMKFLKNQLGEYFRFYDELNAIKEMSGIQARLPYFIDIH